MNFLLELWAFIRSRPKRVFLLPLLLVFLLFAALFVMSSSAVVAPFIYVLF